MPGTKNRSPKTDPKAPGSGTRRPAQKDIKKAAADPLKNAAANAVTQPNKGAML